MRNRLCRWLDWLDRLPLFSLATLGMVMSLLVHRPITDTDMFWQLKLGEMTIRDGIPTHEPFLSTLSDRPHVPVAWFAQLIDAQIRLWFGWVGLQIVDTLVWLGGYIVLAYSMSRQGCRVWPAIMALFLAHACGFAHAMAGRPQSFSLLCFGLLVVLTRSNLSMLKKWLFGSLLLVLWQNLHPSAVAGVIWLGTLAVAEWIAWWFGRGGENRITTSGLTVIAAASLIATPAGFAIFPLSKYNAEASRWFQIGEWLPLWDARATQYFLAEDWDEFMLHFHGSGRFTAFLVLIPSLVVLAFRWRHVRFADALATFPLLVLSFMMHRFILFWVAAMIPVWYCCLVSTHDPHADMPQERPSRQSRFYVSISLAVVWIAALTWHAHQPLHWAAYQAFDAVEALHQTGVNGVVYSNYFYGGTVIDRGYPGWKVTHDGRYYLQPISAWEEHARARAGLVSLENIVEQYHPVAFFLRVDYDDGLIALLEADAKSTHPTWRFVFQDQRAAVFIRK